MGSSALMGLLRLAGLNVGDDSRLTGSHPMNPKGFLELRSQNIFLEVAYPEVYPKVVSPPSIDDVRRAGRQHADAYRKFLYHEFGHNFPIALKAPRLLTLPFLHELNDEFDTRVLLLTRDQDNHVASIQRVWSDLDDPAKSEASTADIRSFLDEWADFRDRLLDAYAFEVHTVPFDDLNYRPHEVMDGVSAFLDVPHPSAEAIDDWIDPSLANRDELAMPDANDGFVRRAVRRVRNLLQS